MKINFSKIAESQSVDEGDLFYLIVDDGEAFMKEK